MLIIKYSSSLLSLAAEIRLGASREKIWRYLREDGTALSASMRVSAKELTMVERPEP